MLTRTTSAARKGFTLLELIVVIAILGILAAIAFVGYQTVLSNTDQTTIDVEQKQIDQLFRATSAATRKAPTALVVGDFEPADLPTGLTGDGTDGWHKEIQDDDYCYTPGASVGAAGSWAAGDCS